MTPTLADPMATRDQQKVLTEDGLVERREAVEHRSGDIERTPVGFHLPRSEWRIVR